MKTILFALLLCAGASICNADILVAAYVDGPDKAENAKIVTSLRSALVAVKDVSVVKRTADRNLFLDVIVIRNGDTTYVSTSISAGNGVFLQHTMCFAESNRPDKIAAFVMGFVEPWLQKVREASAQAQQQPKGPPWLNKEAEIRS